MPRRRSISVQVDLSGALRDEGLAGLADGIDGFLEDVINRYLDTMLRQLLIELRTAAPKDTGRLKRSIRLRRYRTRTGRGYDSWLFLMAPYWSFANNNHDFIREALQRLNLKAGFGSFALQNAIRVKS